MTRLPSLVVQRELSEEAAPAPAVSPSVRADRMLRRFSTLDSQMGERADGIGGLSSPFTRSMRLSAQPELAANMKATQWGMLRTAARCRPKPARERPKPISATGYLSKGLQKPRTPKARTPGKPRTPGKRSPAKRSPGKPLTPGKLRTPGKPRTPSKLRAPIKLSTPSRFKAASSVKTFTVQASQASRWPPPRLGPVVPQRTRSGTASPNPNPHPNPNPNPNHNHNRNRNRNPNPKPIPKPNPKPKP